MPNYKWHSIGPMELMTQQKCCVPRCQPVTKQVYDTPTANRAERARLGHGSHRWSAGTCLISGMTVCRSSRRNI